VRRGGMRLVVIVGLEEAGVDERPFNGKRSLRVWIVKLAGAAAGPR
jgi:hypothetical protein